MSVFYLKGVYVVMLSKCESPERFLNRCNLSYFKDLSNLLLIERHTFNPNNNRF